MLLFILLNLGLKSHSYDLISPLSMATQTQTYHMANAMGLTDHLSSCSMLLRNVMEWLESRSEEKQGQNYITTSVGSGFLNLF